MTNYVGFVVTRKEKKLSENKNKYQLKKTTSYQMNYNYLVKSFFHLTSWKVRLSFDSAIVVSIWYIKRDTSVYISEKNLDFCSAFEIRLLLESSYITEDKWFVSVLN